MITKLFSNQNKKTPLARFGRWTGQGMVEFALALPILLLVAYGLLETGRLLFIYSSTVTAARQAARYGSATGNNDGGTPYYRDCVGIRDAAQRVAFLNSFDDGDISITYDRGLSSGGAVVSIPGVSSDPATDTCSTMNDSTLQLGDRIKVQVSTQWSPIIAIVPSWQGFEITSSAERTILTEVAISITPSGGTWGGPGSTGSLSLSVTSSTTSYDEVGDILSFSYVITNTGSVDITGLSISDNAGISECTLPGTLAAGGSFTCNVSYNATQADLDAGSYTNSVTVNSTQSVSDSKSITINAVQNLALNLTKTPSQTSAPVAGTTITYSYKLTNSGNVTLTAPYAVSDNKIASNSITCPGTGSIAPGSYVTCTGPYTIKNSDVTNKSVTNTASASATFKTTTVTSNNATAIVNTSGISLAIAPSTTTANTLNQKITYVYTIKNESTITVNPPFAITDSKATNITCSSASLAPGATTTCTGEYSITQTDLNSGGTLTNTATATANGGALTSNTASASVTITQTTGLSLTVTPSVTLATSLGSAITYSYVIKNTGNVTVDAPFTVTDTGIIGTSTCTIASGSLAPLATTTCTKTYNVVQADLDAGSIINLATVAATRNGSTITSAQATATVITYNSPRLTLSIASTPTSFIGSNSPLVIKFNLKNTGNTSLTSAYTVTANSFLGTINCSSAVSPLAVGQTTTCTASYTTTTTDVSAGAVNISATAKANNGAITSNTATLSVPVVLGCYVYHRLTTTPPPSVTFSGLGANRKMYMSVINDSATGYTLHISSIEVLNWNYNTHSQQKISNVSFGGVTIVSADSDHASPVTFNSFVGDVSLTPGQTKILEFEFNKNYSETGNEVIKITFTEAGCPTLDSSNGTQVK